MIIGEFSCFSNEKLMCMIYDLAWWGKINPNIAMEN